jgi:predicted RNA binding protein YcfA (HicA-like mRNA interferase family)
MSQRLPQCKPREVIRALEVLGFVLIRQRGSHAFFKNNKTRHTTIIPMHTGDIDRTLLHGIIKEAGLDLQEFLRALRQ